MANRLFAMKYKRVALVDRGANQEAHVVLSKRLEKGDVEGHEFRGNQWTGGGGGGPDGFDAHLRAQGIDPALVDRGAGEGDRIGGTAILDVKAAADQIRATVSGGVLQAEVQHLREGGEGDYANRLVGIGVGLDSAAKEMEMAAITREAGRFDRATDFASSLVDDLYGLGDDLRAAWPGDAGVVGTAQVIEGTGQGISNLIDDVKDTVGADRGAAKRLLPEGSRFAKAEPGESLEADIQEIQAAWRKQHPTSPYLSSTDSWVNETYPDHIIINISEDHFSIPYTQDGEGNFTFDEQAATKVARTWTPVAKGRAHRAWKRSHPGRPLAEMPERFRIVLSDEEAASIVQELGKRNGWGLTRTRATKADLAKVLEPDGVVQVAKVGRKMSTARLVRLKEAASTISSLLAEVDNTPDPEGGTGMAKIDELLKELDDETKAEIEATLAKAAKADELEKANTDLEAKLEAATKAMDTCPECDAKVVPGASKCPKCGAAMGDAAAKRDDRDELAKALADPDLPETMKAYVQKQAERNEELEKQAATDRKAAEDLQKRVDEDIEKRAIDEQVEKVSVLKSLTIKPQDFGAVMHRVAKNTATPEDVKEIERVLASSNAQLETAGITDQIGKGGESAPTGPGEALKALAREVQKNAAEPITFEKAYVQAMETEEGQTLVADMKKEN